MTDDLITRQAALDALGEEPLVWHEDDAGEVAERNQWRRDVAAIKALPSAQPQRIKGRWIDDGLYSDNFPHHAWHCSECEESVLEIDEPWFKFCPSCGADMRKDGDDHES